MGSSPIETIRELMLWCLEAGHQPQALSLQISSLDVLLEACRSELVALEESLGQSPAKAFQTKLVSLGIDLAPQSRDELDRQMDASMSRVSEQPDLTPAQQAWMQMDEVLRYLHFPVHNWTARHLPEASDISPETDLNTLILKEAIATREAGLLELSLLILDSALQAGFDSPWILDNKARALLLLDNPSEAQSLWRQLASFDDPSIAQVAHDSLQSLEQQLQESFQSLSPLEQDSRADAELSSELKSLVDQAIQLRNQGEALTSLTLLEELAHQGYRSPWLADNRARALMDINRSEEAINVWTVLSQSPNADVAEASRTMLTQVEMARLNQLRKNLNELSQSTGQPLQSLNHNDAHSARDMEKLLLEDAIQLRESGEAQTSFDLLTLAETAGLKGGWFQDNKARSLVNLGRRAEAISLWQSLAESDDELRTLSQEALAKQQIEHLRELQAQLTKICLEQGWVAQELQISRESMEALEQAVLKESIRSRDAGQAATSLLLIEAAQAGGMNSPWLKDNQARALVNLQRVPEAVELWRELEALPDQEALAAMAQDMLKQYAAEADRLAATNKAMELAQQGQMEQAKTLLVRAMLADPGWEGYTTALKQLVKQEKGSQDNTDLLERELEDDRLNLEAFDVYLDLVEERLKAAAASGST